MMKRIWLSLLLASVLSAPLSAADPLILSKQFAEADVPLRITLVDQLGRNTLTGPEELTVLNLALTDPSPEVRWRAARAISAQQAVSDPVIDSLIRLLDDPEPKVRTYAAFALGHVARNSASAAAALAKHVTDDAPAVQRASIEALRKLQVDHAVIRPVLADALRSSDPAVIANAAQIMATLGEAALPEVIGALHDEQTRYWACLVIQDLGPLAQDAVPALRPILRSPESEERLEAALALAAIGPAAQTTAEDIAGLLATDPKPSVRLAAAFALGKLEVPQVGDTALTTASTSDDPVLRLVSVWALHRIYPENQPYATATADKIMEGIQSEDPRLRAMAARTLMESKVPLDQSAPFIAAALKYSNPVVVELAVKAIVEQGAEALPELRSGLTDRALQLSALNLIQRLGPQAVGLVDEVRGLLASEDESVRREALFALAAMGDASQAAADDVTKLYLESNSREDRLAAIYAAGRMGKASPELIAALRELAGDATDQQMQVAALWAMARLEPADADALGRAVTAMAAALDNTSRDSLKIALANSLSEIGPQAQAAIPALKNLQLDPNPNVQQAAALALEKIGAIEQ